MADPRRRFFDPPPVTVSLWGNPDVAHEPLDTHVQARARHFFEANPSRQFQWQEITHAQLARLDKRALFNGSTDHPRSHTWNTHREAEIDGPGPHSLLFNRDFYANAPYRPGPDGLTSRPAGVLILPNFSWRSQRWSADVQEWQGQCMWVAWEDATGSGLTAEEVAIGTLLSMIEDADARRQDSAPG